MLLAEPENTHEFDLSLVPIDCSWRPGIILLAPTIPVEATNHASKGSYILDEAYAMYMVNWRY